MDFSGHTINHVKMLICSTKCLVKLVLFLLLFVSFEFSIASDSYQVRDNIKSTQKLSKCTCIILKCYILTLDRSKKLDAFSSVLIDTL